MITKPFEMTLAKPIILSDTHDRWDKLVIDVARTLSQGGVPNILFGSYALSQYGVPYGFSVIQALLIGGSLSSQLTSDQGADFVVDDLKLPQAIILLTAAGLPECEHGLLCQELHAGRLYPIRPPSMHVHVQHLFKEIKDLITLKVYTRSETLWELPDLSTFVSGKSRDVCKVSAEKRLDCGEHLDMEEVLKDDGDLWIPSTRILFRAYALLAIRDDRSPVKDYWFDHLLMMTIHLQDIGRLDIKSCGDELQPLIRSITMPGVDMAKAWEETVSLTKNAAAKK